jgi:ATP-binding cassette, subfamily B, bacterial
MQYNNKQLIMSELYAAIEKYVLQGIPTEVIRKGLVQAGWPEPMVKQALEAWLSAHGRRQAPTDFWKWLKKYQKRATPAVLAVVALNIVGASIMLLKPWPVKILADSAFGGIPAVGPLEPYTGTSTLILITSAMTLTLFLLGALFGTLTDYLLLKIGFWLNKGVKKESFRHILHLPMYHEGRLAKGDYIYRQNVVTNSLSDLVLGTTSSIIQSIIMIIGVIIIMSLFNFTLTIITVTLIPLLFLTMKIIGPRLGKYAQAMTEVASETASSISESIDNSETVQSFTLENKLINNVVRLWDKGYELSKKILLWGDLLTNTNGLLVVLATSSVMYFGGSAALRGEMTLGELLIFMTYMSYLLQPVETLVRQITTRNQKIIDVNRIYEVLTDHEGIEDLRLDNHLPQNIKGQIEFQDVSYSYRDNVVFSGLNLTIPAGQKVAIIGPSGGGKSTILKLLPLFIEPVQGRILIDGYDTQNVSLKDLRNKIAWVAQAPQLFSGTIVDNIRDGDVNRNIEIEEIKNAVIVANVAEFTTKMPLGLGTPAGENGGSLSGGQKQRVSIARALVKDAPILCLDEPTAALDAKSESYIRDSLMQMIEGKTVMMVTHRRSLLALMDIVYVLENGILTDINNLGGLDNYLAKLEGIETENAQKVIEKEKIDAPQEVNLVEQELAKLSRSAEFMSSFNPIKETGDKDTDDEVTINLH